MRTVDPRPSFDHLVGAGEPSISFSQLFIAAHKEINRSEQTKTAPPVIDAIAEPVTTDEAKTEKVEW